MQQVLTATIPDIPQRRSAGSAWHETGLVFTTEFGEPCDPLNAFRALRAAATKAGLPHAGLYTLRHSAASVMISGGVPLEVVDRRHRRARGRPSNGYLTRPNGNLGSADGGQTTSGSGQGPFRITPDTAPDLLRFPAVRLTGFEPAPPSPPAGRGFVTVRESPSAQVNRDTDDDERWRTVPNRVQWWSEWWSRIAARARADDGPGHQNHPSLRVRASRRVFKEAGQDQLLMAGAAPM
jgi:hypothetical protein